MSRRCHTVLIHNDVNGYVLGVLWVGEGLPQGFLYAEALLASQDLPHGFL